MAEARTQGGTRFFDHYDDTERPWPAAGRMWGDNRTWWPGWKLYTKGFPMLWDQRPTPEDLRIGRVCSTEDMEVTIRHHS